MFRRSRTPDAPSEPTDQPAVAPDPARAQGPGPLVSARGVTKTYRTGDVEVEALRGVDLDVDAGEFVVIMGPSGNGKTTLLNCCSGIDDIDQGTVTIDGLDLHGLSDRARTAHRAARMGFVFQSFNLVPVFSAAENCELPLLASGVRPSEARRRAEELLGRVGLASRIRHKPAELSGGEQQRVAIARSLVAEPAVVWADEPTGNLDSATADAVLELFQEVNAGGQTLVVVTHDASIGARAERLVTVTDGRITDDRPQGGSGAGEGTHTDGDATGLDPAVGGGHGHAVAVPCGHELDGSNR